MFRTYLQDQTFLLPPSLKDFIQEDHPGHLINDLVERMDVRALEARYGEMGQPAYAVRLMLKVILYGFTVGLFSSRKLARACRENLAFQYLAGMERPAFKTIIEFRKRHRDDMKAAFLQPVKPAREMGLVLPARVALDGSKVTANASKRKAMSYGRMQEEEKKLKAEIEEFLKQISFADPEARCFAKGGDGARYVHNVQVAVDMDSQIIVENHIEDSVSDAKAAEPALANMEQSVGIPQKLVGDGGYGKLQTIESCESRGVEPGCATRREETAESPAPDAEPKGSETPTVSVGAFAYDGLETRFTCPHGVKFGFDHWNEDGTKATYPSPAGGHCSCGTSQRQDGQRRLTVSKEHLGQRKLRQILARPENELLYSRRKCTVEPVLGQIKSGIGFDRFLYRGRRKVASEWNGVCAALNLKKMAAAVLRSGKRQGASLLPPLGQDILMSWIADGAHRVPSLVPSLILQISPKLAYAQNTPVKMTNGSGS